MNGESSFDQGKRAVWLVTLERLCCLMVLVLVALIWLRVRQLPPGGGTAGGGSPTPAECACPVEPETGEPSGAPILPEPDSINIVGRVTQNGTPLNGTTVVLQEDVSGTWQVRRTTVSHFSQHNATAPYGAAGWYTFFELTAPSGVSTRQFRICRLNESNMANCPTFSLTSTTASGNHAVSDIVVP